MSELLPSTAADMANSEQHEYKYSYLPQYICHRARIGGCASLSPSEVERERSPMHCMPEAGPKRKSRLDGRVPNQDVMLQVSQAVSETCPRDQNRFIRRLLRREPECLCILISM